MNLERFCLKFLAQAEPSLDRSKFVEIFHEWIRERKLPGTLIDVADYLHVPHGPGVMLIAHEINYGMDWAGGQFGLYAQRKLGDEETHQERLLGLIKSAATFGELLESDRRVKDKLKLEGGKFYYLSNDRLHAPNTAETFQSLKPDLEAVASTIYPGQKVSVTRLENDPRERLTAVIEGENAVAISALARVAA